MKLIIFLSFLILGTTSAWSAVSMGSNMKLIGHRGASDSAPENTLESTLLSFNQGAAGAECDVQLTKDGEVILLHDDTLQRTTGVNKKASELTWAEIKELDAGSWFDKDNNNNKSQWSSVRIPRLEDIFIALLKHPGKILVVELKENNPNLPLKVAELIKKYDKKGSLSKQIYFISFHHELLDQMKKLTPTSPAFYLTTYRDLDAPVRNSEELKSMIRKAKVHGIDGLDFEWAPIINKDFVKELKASGLKSLVWVYKEDDKIENIKQCAEAGIDYFTTNNPAKFLVELNKITL